MSDFESMTYAEMISNARASLDFGTKELYEEQESFSYDEIVEDLERLENLFPDENYEYEDLEDIEWISEINFDGHGNYIDDEYFFKRDYEGQSCSLYYDEDEECCF